MTHSTHQPSICEASGWWALYQRRNNDGTYRVRIAAWMTEFVSTADSEYTAVRAMVAGDGPELVPADWREDFRWLWHDGDSHCSCGAYPGDPAGEDDIYWCEECIGVIQP